MLRRLATSVLLLSSLLVCTGAAAQYGGPEQIQPTSSALWGELGFTTGESEGLGGLASARTSALSPVIEGYFGITDVIEAAFQWGLVFADAEYELAGVTEEDTAFAVGNPSASALFLSRMDDAVLRLGAGLALPVADVGDATTVDDRTKAIAYDLAAAMRGQWDRWLWEPDRLTVVVPQFRLDSRSRDLSWAIDASMGLMVDTGDDDREVEVPVQVALEGGGRLGRSFVVGGRLQAVWVPTQDEGDAAQLSVEPFVRVELENAFFLGRLTINLDEPLGFAFDEGKVWGVHLGGGTRF